MEQLLWSGFVHLLYRLPVLKLALTLHCQICGHVSRCGDELARHLYQHHEALVAESSTYQQLLTWVLFQDFGCACNPTRGFGTPGHMCTALLQAAMLGVQAHWQLFLPWTFRTNELMSHIGDLLTLTDLKRISLCLLTRQFDKLWRDGALMNMLKSHCTICGESVSLQYIIVHLRLEHQLGPNDLHPVVVQLCRIFGAEHPEDPYCDHCQELLPTLDVLTFDPVPELHLPGCPLILHLAAFLMHPVLHRKPLDPLAWPSPQDVEAAFQRQEHQRLLFNAWNSDTTGQDFDLLATCGMLMIKDDTLRDIIKHECLMCHKFFIMPGALVKHLQQHDFKQLNTLWCLYRLQLICQPCLFCGSDQHEESRVCPALLNLAVLLTNGRRSGQSEYDLEWPTDSRPAPQPWHQRRGRKQAQQTPTEEGPRFIYNTAAMVKVMAKILLRHEDTIHVLLQEMEFVLFLKPGEGSLLPILMACHKEWQEGPKTHTLRHTMALTMISTLKERLDRLQGAPASADVVKDCIRFNLIDASQQMPYLRWDANHHQLVPSKESPLPIGEVSKILQSILLILQSETEITLRFHALSKLQMEESEGKAIPFLWTVGSRTQGELWNLLRKISYHSVWQLVRLTLRPQNQQRTNLAKQLGRMM